MRSTRQKGLPNRVESVKHWEQEPTHYVHCSYTVPRIGSNHGEARDTAGIVLLKCDVVHGYCRPNAQQLVSIELVGENTECSQKHR